MGGLAKAVFSLVVVCSTILPGPHSQSSEAAFTNLIVFGDSLSDTGNDHANSFGFAAHSPYVDGRFTNGPNYVDYLSTLLGLGPPVYSEAGGLNHAHGGAQVSIDPPSTSWIIDSLETQQEKYFDSTNSVADPQALYVVFGGANDVRDTSVSMTTTAMELVGIVNNLVTAGATNILVPNIPDLGITPEVTEFGQGAGAASTARTQLFNDTLASGLADLAMSANIYQFDTFGALNELVADAAAGGTTYGITNATDDCWEGGPAGIFSGLGLGDGLFPAPVCDNPDEYLFWDILHPTTAVHELLAEFMYAEVTVVDADFDNNGELDCADIDALVAEIAAATHSPEFDLTGDGQVDLDDRDQWLVDAGAMNLSSGNAYLLGDATLDGVVDGQDFLRWNAEKFTETAAWCSGDFTADGIVDGQDFVLWNSHKFTSADQLPAVPETTSDMMLPIYGILVMRGLRRRRRRDTVNSR